MRGLGLAQVGAGVEVGKTDGIEVGLMCVVVRACWALVGVGVASLQGWLAAAGSWIWTRYVGI